VKIETCYTCKMEFGMSDSFYDTALRMKEKLNFYCPAGHLQHYCTGEIELDKMRRERDRLQQRVAERDDRVAELQRSNAATRGQVTKIKNRVANGVCPCCNRTFANLMNHMKSKHPDYKKDEAA
jgi:hypothetical protein